MIYVAFLLAIGGFCCYLAGEARYRRFKVEDKVTAWLLDITVTLGMLFIFLVYIWCVSNVPWFRWE